MFLVVSEEEAICPKCGTPLEYRDRVKRVHKTEGGNREWYIIRRMRCPNEHCSCGLHRELPDKLLPYKHYDSGLIEDVVDDVVPCEDPYTEDYPCEDTMNLWKLWWEHNRDRVEGWLRSVAYRFLGFSDEFLKSAHSLISELKRRLYRGWLLVVVRVVYNTGGWLVSERPPG